MTAAAQPRRSAGALLRALLARTHGQLALVSVSHGALALTAAIYGGLIPRRLAGAPDLSDAFFAAYSIYTLLAMFSVSLRVTVAPVLCRPPADDSAVRSRYGWMTPFTATLFLALAAALAVLSLRLGAMVSPGRAAAAGRLILTFAPAVFLQGMAFYFSGVLAARGRIAFVSASITVATVAGAGAFLLTPGLAAISPILGLTTFNAIWTATLWARARADGLVALSLGRMARHAPEIRGYVRAVLIGSAPYVAVNAAYVISQALAGRCAQGLPTVFAYAYLMISVGISLTAGSLGIGLVRQFTEHAADDRTRFRAYALHVTAVAGIVSCGMLGAFAVLARPLAELLFSVLAPGAAGTPADHFAPAVWLLAPGGWAIGIFSTLTPMTVALGLRARFAGYAAAVLAAHAMLGVALHAHFGLPGVCVGLTLALAAATLLVAARLRAAFGASFPAALARRVLPLPAATAALVAAATAVQGIAGAAGYRMAGVLASMGIFAAGYAGLLLIGERETCRAAIRGRPE